VNHGDTENSEVSQRKPVFHSRVPDPDVGTLSDRKRFTGMVEVIQPV
jgi:hypothetical protein